MKKLVLAGLALAALGGAAAAADRPVKAPYQPPAPPPPPVYSWTGFYIGVNAGAGWDRRDVVEGVTSSFCNATLVGCGTGALSAAAIAALPAAFPVRSSGFIGGGQLGYNYQTGAIVWGVEADFQGANIHGSNVQSLTAVPPGFAGNTVTIAGVADKKLDFLGTVRGRVGVAFAPVLPVLLYATGGFAYGHVSSSTTLTEAVGGPCFCGLPAVATGSISTSRTGWSAGAGGEWAFSPALSVRVEWLHYDLGTPSYGLTPLTQLNGAGIPFFGISTVSSTTFRGDIVRAGLNWKFGGYGGPGGPGYGGPANPAY